jgi:chemotaxis protein CheZ
VPAAIASNWAWQLRSIEISHTHIPAAADELDAVVAETAAATGALMDACDRLQAQDMSGASHPLQDAINAEVTAIFEACSFQDITGQRITKVVKALKNIEQKVADILKALGHASKSADKALANVAAEKETPKGDAALLNGPQLSGKAISQEEIDKLLSSFD